MRGGGEKIPGRVGRGAPRLRGCSIEREGERDESRDSTHGPMDMCPRAYGHFYN